MCEVKYCSSCRFTGATISTSRICFFKRRLTLLTTTVTPFFVASRKKEKKSRRRRRKTTDNDLSLFRLSSIAGWHETNTARHNCSPMTVNVRYRPIDQWLGELSNGGYRLKWLRLYSPGHDMERERACVGNEAKYLSGWSRHSVCRKSSWSLSHAMHMKTHFMIIISLD